MNFGYIRVSTDKQLTDRQHDILSKYSIDKLYEEKRTGTNRNREQLALMLEYMRSGDTLYIESFSRLARNTKDLINIVEELTAKGVILRSHKENFDTSTASGKLMLTMFAALSQFERDIISERTREGLKAARARGHLGGRKPVEQDKIDRAIKMYQSKAFSISEICKTCGISKPTLYRYLK